jgi:glycine/serine hydroxymethyltransferase
MKITAAPMGACVLEKNGIIVDAVGRIGVAEITHLGMKPEDMGDIAKRIREAL